jgi:TonB family protein
MHIRRSGRNLLSLPMGISAGIHAVLIVSLIFLSWNKIAPKPETPPIKIQNVFLQSEKENSPSRKSNPVPQKQAAEMISNSVKLVPAKQYQQPKLIEFSPHTPAPLVTQTIQRTRPAHSKSPKPPSLWRGKLVLQIATANASPSRQFSTASPRKGVTVRTVSGELNYSPLKISPVRGVTTVERWIPTPKTQSVQIASIPSDFIDENEENTVSASLKSGPSEKEMDFPTEDLESIRKGFTSGVWGRIAKVRYYPNRARKHGWEGKPVIEFILARNGDLLSSSITLASPHRILDDAALDAIKSAVPYPKIPEALKLDSIRFKLPISFILEEP